jgi:hypothetical protein
MMGGSYDDWTVQELKEALKEMGLPVSGEKRVLIERLDSRGKNYLEEGALDTGDANLLEQIKAKYRPLDYRPPEHCPKDGSALHHWPDSGYATDYYCQKCEEYVAPADENYAKISYAIIALGLSAVAAIFFSLIVGNLAVGTLFLVMFFGVSVALVIIIGINQEFKKTEIVGNALDEVLGALFCVIIAILMFGAFLIALLLRSPIEWMGFYCCSSVSLFILPMFALMRTEGEDEEVRRRKTSRKKRARDHKRAWKDAHKHEEHSQFDAATRIWSKLGEEGEVERVAGLKSECLCVVLKRKIKDLTEMGADCTQLEEQLAMIETALESTNIEWLSDMEGSIGTGGKVETGAVTEGD